MDFNRCDPDKYHSVLSSTDQDNGSAGVGGMALEAVLD